MKVTCEQQELLKALRIATKVKAKNIPVLSHVELEAQAGWLFVRSTDLSTFVEVFVEADVEDGGRALLPARELLDLVRNLPPIPLTIAGAWPESVTVAGVAFTAADPDDYPELPAHPTENHFRKVPADELQKGLKRTSFCASRDVSRAQLQGVAITGGSLVGCDGKRLARYKLQELGDLEGIVPLPAVTAVEGLLKLQKDMACETGVAIHEARATFRTAVGAVTARLIEGQLPDYIAMLPTEFAAETVVQAAVLRRLVKQAAAPLDKDSKIVHLTVRGDDLYVASKATTAQGLPVCAHSDVQGDPDLAPAFCQPFLEQGLKACGKETVKLCLNRKKPAALISGHWAYYFMPGSPA